MTPITIVTFLWNEPQGRMNHLFMYGAKHVRTMRAMIDRHLKHPHRFVCVTDMPDGIDDDIKIVPLDRSLLLPRSRFPKLTIFRPDAADTIGEVIWTFDLDTVICGPLDPLLERFEGRDIVLWQNPNWPGPKRTKYNSSTVLLRAGTRSSVWTRYESGIEPRDDQDWMTKCLGHDETVWTGDDGIYWAPHVGADLPKNARIVTFAGQIDPSLPEVQRKQPWISRHWRDERASAA